MKIFLTGSSGFIGRNIKEQLHEKYQIYSPTSTELDLTDGYAVSEFVQKNKIDNIIHCATINQKRRNLCQNELSNNLKMFFSLANCSQLVDKIIYFGSGAEFDKSSDIISAKEDDIGANTPLLNDYSISKYTINQLKNDYNNIYNLRLFGVYGKYENKESCFPSHLCNCVLNKQLITIRQDAVFDFLYIDDLIKPLQYMLENEPNYREYNVCSGEKIKLSEMAKIIQDVAKINLEIKFLNSGFANEYTGDNTRIKQEIDFNTTGIEQGLYELYKFYSNEVK